MKKAVHELKRLGMGTGNCAALDVSRFMYASHIAFATPSFKIKSTKVGNYGVHAM
jgi:hypothetical protein